MDSSAAQLQRHFLGHGGPLLAQAVTWLAAGWTGAGPLDLRETLVVVSTRQSGRRLREALASHAAARGQAVFPPRVHTPDTLLAEGAEAPDVASRLEALLAWVDVLRAADLAALPALFPVAPPRADFDWAWRLAESFYRLQTQLTEGGLALADVLARCGEEFPETERWAQLAELERAQVQRLATLGLREPHAAWRAFARAPALLEGVQRVAMLAVPDPLPLALDVLEKWAREVPVAVAVFAAADDAAAFDAWGRPLPAAWARRELNLPDFERRVHLCADPAAEAKRAALAAARYGAKPEGWVALGLADPEVLPLLENELSRAQLAAFNPEGRARRQEALFTLLSALAALGREPWFDAVAELARCPDFLAAFVARGGPTASAAHWLAGLDRLRERHLPPDLAAAQRAAKDAEVRRGLDFIAELHGLLTHAPFPQNAAAALAEIFRDRQFDLTDDGDARALDDVEAWRETMRECATAAAAFPELAADDWWEIARRLFGDGRRAGDKSPGALELQGWLELLWEDAPHLIVAGLNDGLVPEAVVGDAFLPESLRERLGLKTNAARFARDAYMLHAIAAGRRLDVLFAKTSSIGEPLRPSRLLLQCAETELPARIAFLFRPAAATQTNLPWTRAWKLQPASATIVAPPSVAVTGLRAWLACPFRFYLAQVLRMEAVDPTKSELDARDFGTLCHAALEAMALDVKLRDCTDEKVLREFLLAALDRAARERLGEDLTLPLVIQLESARQRLGRAAAVQARERAEGWTIERAEWKFELDLGGLAVRGKIDRVDRHETSGAWRVLDYKTSDAFSPPHKTHVRPFRRGDELLPGWMRVVVNGREQMWADLQLPLYVRALTAELGAGEIAAGYFNLPKAVGETAISLWSELTPELLAGAHACADGVAAAIRRAEFWPPAELAADRDPFASLFHHGAEESVAWSGAGSPAP